ncbi:MAG: SDR family oxidoreductase [Bacteroidetes bacterium]|nr:SDR family oxidoreductase [Bacteroidota bacterium]
MGSNQLNPFSLLGKQILVTGASSGIGRAIATECSKMGAKVIITARNEERLQETLSQMYGDGHSLILADLAVERDRISLVEQAPKLDGLVNCAGIVRTLLFPFVDAASLEEVMNVNFTAPTLFSAQLVKNKKLVKNASIVFISSISGNACVWGGNSMYSASKGAINGVMKNMALDLAAKGIRVNSVNPGMIETHIFDGGVIDEEQLVEDKKRYPLKRYGKPEEVAYATIYLLSDASSWVTGSSLVIDGGYTLN